MKDLVAIDAQGKDYLPSSQYINLQKYRLLWTTLSYIRAAQSKAPSLTVDTYYMRVLRVRQGCGLWVWHHLHVLSCGCGITCMRYLVGVASLACVILWVWHHIDFRCDGLSAV